MCDDSRTDELESELGEVMDDNDLLKEEACQLKWQVGKLEGTIRGLEFKLAGQAIAQNTLRTTLEAKNELLEKTVQVFAKHFTDIDTCECCPVPHCTQYDRSASCTCTIIEWAKEEAAQ
jgi:hypothetical protein